MTPTAARAMLDRQLSDKGQSLTLRRYTGPDLAPLSTWADLPIIAKVIPANTEELAAGINMTGRRLILSPTALEAASWPEPETGRDAIMDGDARRVIEVWSLIKMGSTVVRIEVQVG